MNEPNLTTYYGMTAIIIAKTRSVRCPGKNFRNFHKGKSLVDIAIEETLQAGIPPREIWLSTDNADDPEVRHVVDLYEIRVFQQPEEICGDAIMSQVFRQVTSAIMGRSQNDILWRQVVDPMFALQEGTKRCLDTWEKIRDLEFYNYDSLVMCYQRPDYYLQKNEQDGLTPVGWNLGMWQPPSPKLPMTYVLPFTLSILKRETAERVQHMVGLTPYWYALNSPTVDIDTEQDFEFAQVMYGHYKNRERTALTGSRFFEQVEQIDHVLQETNRPRPMADETGELDLTQWNRPKCPDSQ